MPSSIFWRTLEMTLTDSETNLILTGSSRSLIIHAPIADQEPTFTVTDTKLYVPVVNLSTEDNAKLLKSGLKRTID